MDEDSITTEISEGNKKIYISGTGTVLVVMSVIFSMSLYGVSITNWSGETIPDILCEGNEFDPCYNEIMICSSEYDIIFSDRRLFVQYFDSDTAYSKLYSNVTGKWEPFDLRNKTLKRGSCLYLKQYGYKKDPSDVIKWGISSDLYNLDPIWGISSTILYFNETSADRYYELGHVANITGIVNYTNGSVCLDIDAKGYGDNYICTNGTVQLNFTTFATNEKFFYVNIIEDDTEDASACVGTISNCANSYDEDWDTCAHFNTTNQNATIYENYTISTVNKEEVIWTVKHEIEDNCSIEGYCWNHSSSDWIEIFSIDSASIPSRKAEWTFETNVTNDESGNGYNWSYNHGTSFPQQNNTEKVFGSYSGYFDGYEVTAGSNTQPPYGLNHFLYYSNYILGTGDITLDGWIKINNLSKYMYIYTERRDNWGWHVQYYPYGDQQKGRLSFEWRGTVVYSDINISDNNWHWFAIRRSGQSSYIWFDGQQSSDTKTSPHTMFSQVTRLGSGRSNSGIFHGYMDNVRGWNSALSDSVIENYLYQPPINEYTLPNDCYGSNNWIGTKIKMIDSPDAGAFKVKYFEGKLDLDYSEIVVEYITTSNVTKHFRFNNNDRIINATLNITANNNTDDIELDMGDDGTVDVSLPGTLNGTIVYVNELNDSNTEYNLTYAGESNKVVYITLPRQSTITVANMSIKGFTTHSAEKDDEDAYSYHWTSSGCQDGHWHNIAQAVDEDWLTFARLSCDKDSGTIDGYIIENTTLPYQSISTNVTGFAYIKNHALMSYYVYAFNFSSSTYNLKYSCSSCGGHRTYNEALHADEVQNNKTISIKSRFRDNSMAKYPRFYQYETKILYTLYTKNISVDTGNDAYIDYQSSGDFDGNTTIDLNISAIQAYLDSDQCTDVVCDVPIIIGSKSGGTLQISDIDVQYTFNPIDLNVSAIQAYLDGYSGNQDIDVPIKITANSWGNITLNDLDIDYYGSITYNITAHYDGDTNHSASNDSHNMYIVFSNYSIAMPYSWTDEILFFADSNSSKNVTPYLQDDDTPIYNFTSLGYDKNINISLRINATIDSCCNLTLSNDNNKSNGRIIDTNHYSYISNLEFGSTSGIWMWVDLENCTEIWIDFREMIEIEACCFECVACW